MSRRVVVSLFLLVAILPLFGLISSAPETQGQAFTTITTYTTRPTTVTTIRVSIVPITGTTTFTRSDMTTSSLTQPRKLFSGTILLPAPGPNFGCWVDNRRFGAKKGEVVSVNIESDNEFSLYLMTEKDFTKWEKTRKCSPGEVSDFTGAFDITSYNEQLVIGNDGQYRFVFLNFGHDKAVIKLKAEVVGVAYETTSVVTSHVVSLQYFTDTMTLTTIATGTVVRTEQVGLPLGQNSMLIVAVVLVAVVAVVAAIVLRRRRHEKPVAAVPTGAPVESQLAAKRFCINCGAELPATVNFCNKCGSKQ
ncbi:MAG: zinc ribbon domain-containing protein [Candidatus Bathyarchaeia archaeon]